MNWILNCLRTLARGIRTLSPTCKEATRLQSQALESPLPLFRRVGLRIHLLMCHWCRRYGKQIAFLRAAAHDCAEEDKLPGEQKLSPEARERIRKRILVEKK